MSGAIVSFPLDAIVCRTALSLFRNISGNDLLKTRLLREGGLRLVLGCMSQHKGDKTLQVCVWVCCGWMFQLDVPVGFSGWMFRLDVPIA